MKFSVKNRLLLNSLLPREGSLLNLKLLRVLREELSFSEEEHKDLNIRQENDMVIWNMELDIEKEIEVPDSLKKVILDTLKKMDKEEKLADDHVELCEMFGYEGEK